MNFLQWLITRKKSGESMAKKELTEMQLDEAESKPGFFQKIFFWVIIPLVFCIALLLVATMFTEKNIFDYVEDIPFIGSKNDSNGAIDQVAETEKKVAEIQAELKQKEAELQSKQTEVDQTLAKNQELEIEIERLQYELDKMTTAQAEAQKDFNEIVSTYEKMSAKKAAPIIAAMDDAEALRILSSLKPTTITAIFEKMTAEQAAKYTQMLTGE